MGLATAIGAAAVVGGSIIGSKSANKNAKRAAQTSAENNAQNTALQREIYGQNKALLSPYSQRGNAAGDAINALLGLGGSQPQYQQPQVQPNALAQLAGGQPDLQYRAGGYNLPGMPGVIGGYGGGTFNMDGAQATPVNTGGISPQQAQEDAFGRFRDSTGYQFRLGEGMNALNSGYAGAGVLQSGDAMRAAQDYGQNFASNEFGNYYNMLANQQGVGLSGASAVVGVGQNYANNITNMNTQNANNQANAQLARTNPFANALGTIGSGLFNYGMGKI